MAQIRVTPSVPIKPCPFCGTDGEVYTRQDEALSSHNIVTWTSVSCPDCNVGFDWPEGAQPDAITQWNTRHPAEPST